MWVDSCAPMDPKHAGKKRFLETQDGGPAPLKKQAVAGWMSPTSSHDSQAQSWNQASHTTTTTTTAAASAMQQQGRSVLHMQKKNLLLKVEEMRKESEVQAARISELLHLQESWEKNLQSVTKQWEMLNTNLKFMLVRVDTTRAVQALQAPESTDGEPSSNFDPVAVPKPYSLLSFLEKLLSADMGSSMDVDEKTLDEGLLNRKKITGQLLMSVVDGISKQATLNKQLEEKLLQSISPEAAKEELEKSLARLRQEKEDLLFIVDDAQLRMQAAQNQASEQENSLLRERSNNEHLRLEVDNYLEEAKKSARTIESLRLQVAELEESLKSAEASSPSAGGSSSSGAADRKRDGQSAISTVDSEMVSKLERDLREAKGQSAEQRAQLDIRESEIRKLRSELQHLNSRIMTQNQEFYERIRQRSADAGPKRPQQPVIEDLGNLVAGLRQDCVNLEAKLHAEQSRAEEMLSKSEKDFLDIVQEKDRLLTQLRNDNDQLRTSCMSLQEQLKQVSGRDQSDTIKELNSLIQGLTTEKSRLYEQIKGLQQEGNGKSATGLALRAHRAEESMASLREEVQKLQDNPDGSTQASALQLECEQLRRDIAEAKSASRVGELEGLVSELQAVIAARSEESDALMNEIDSISSALEEAQDQSSRLAQKLSERDDHETRLINESVKARHGQTLLLAEKEAMQSRLQAAEEERTAQVSRAESLEHRLRDTMLMLEKTREDYRATVVIVDGHRNAAQNAEEEIERIRDDLQKGQEYVNQVASMFSEKVKELETSDASRADLTEELAKLKRRLKRYQSEKVEDSRSAGASSSGGAGDEEEFRQMVKCSQCHKNNKNVVITKCFHAFCSTCIEENLGVRNRKCPRCAKRFDKGDVHEFYL